MAAPEIDWSSAQVRDGALSVAITGARPKGWKRTFLDTVRLLGPADWGEVSLRKGTVRVTEVSPGQEERLRHFLEGAVEQANVSHPPSDDDGAGDAGSGPAETGPDAEMTARFRAFSGGAADLSPSSP
ncbi:MAG TPA: hypothetical protein VFN55_16400 [Solirubrobacteraceae bacterium]|nr:hypothetical protein [Solirubrobacteraceae bacterium]